VESDPHERQPTTSITVENSDHVDALIRENRRTTVHELSGILNISDGSVKTAIRNKRKKGANISVISPG
jgi:predicted transcriptional regulator